MSTTTTPSLLTAVVRWFDSWAGARVVSAEAADDPDWLRIVPFVAMHLACLAVIWVGWSPVAVITAIALYWVRMFAVTGFYHRYFSHRTFKTSRFWQFVFGLWGGTAVQRGPLWWAAHHRHHHLHSDQEEDRHSPVQHGFYWSHMGWIICKGNFRTNIEQVRDLAKFPELVFLDRFDTLVPILFAASTYGFGALLGSWFPDLGTSGPQMLVWAFFISTVVLFHGTCTINSLAHVFGRRRYQTTDHSRNSFLLALVTLGEGWHNNHHHFPAATRQGFFWWELDITYYGLKLMSWLGIVRDLRGVPERVKAAERL